MTTMPSTLSCKAEAGYGRIEKGNAVSFPKLGIVLEKNQVEFKSELKVEVEGHLPL